MKKILIDETLQNEFIKKGYVQCPLLSSEEVAYILGKLADLKPDDNFNPDGNGTIQVSFHVTLFDTNIAYKHQTNQLISDLISSKIEQYLAGYKILTSAFFIKPPSDGYLFPHTNWNFVKETNETTVTVWCPLVDVNESNGTIQLVEGSHKIGNFISSPTFGNYCQNISKEIQDKYSTPINLKAGECIIFDDSLLHWSEKNNSNSPRLVIASACIPENSTPAHFYFDQNEPHKGFEVFEINSDFFIERFPYGMFERPTKYKSLGFVENHNKMLTEDEFIELIKNGKEFRDQIYNPEKFLPKEAEKHSGSWFNKISKKFFGK